MLTDYIALFGAGVASFLAPCVVPLVPAYLGMLADTTAKSAGNTPANTADNPGKAVSATLIFVLGFGSLYAVLGIAAGSIGEALESVQTWVQRIGGVLIVAMGLALVGVAKGWVMREKRLVSRLPEGGGPVKSFTIGVAFGAAWSPCVGPLLSAALTVAAAGGDPIRGGLLLLSYAAGIGVPFILASLGLASFPGVSAFLRRISTTVERVAGVMLVVLGVLLITGTYGELTTYLAEYTPSIDGL